ncbi:MAG TPA: alpha/beta hydrolase [Cytophagaceae bacterium]|jgi:pimeloyl-ACP methyl ester carboxylesterase|nr:alpha/beta hydrolase [Cytophagaceae bacterium]
MPDKIYFISGLGADKKVFRNLIINHPFQQHIEWEIPFKNESLTSYCSRLITQIDTRSEVILVGLSFGGIIAQEIAKIIPVRKLIIVSSVKNENEMDWTLHFIRKTKLYKLPPSLLKFLNKYTANYYFGIQSEEESLLLKKIIADTNPVFLPWANNQILHWKNHLSQNVVHIHGTKDKIFPIKNITNCMPIEGGGHFMILNKAKEVSAFINQAIGA